ncbi:MAG TPA: sugar-binding protein, partial [Corynebacterium sp.]|nr:sugar-binding protein [Corynebacterium sp.]
MRTLWGVLVCTALTCCGAWAQEALATAGAEPIIIPVVTDPSPVIDGSLDDWANRGVLRELNRREQVTYSPELWTGLEDLSGWVRFGYDQMDLMVACHVVDSYFLQDQSGTEAWRGDHVMLTLDFIRSGRMEDVMQLGLSPGSLSSPDGSSGTRPELIIWRPAGMSTEGARVSARRTPEGYDIEAAIPWAVLEVTPVEYLTFGLQLGFSDCDTSPTVQQKVISISTKPWRARDPERLTATGLADRAGHFPPDGFEPAIELASSLTLKQHDTSEYVLEVDEIPAGRIPTLKFKARIDSARASGCGGPLKTTINGESIGPQNIAERPAQMTSVNGTVLSAWYGAGVRLWYGPSYELIEASPYKPLDVISYEYVLRLDDMIRQGRNTISFENVDSRPEIVVTMDDVAFAWLPPARFRPPRELKPAPTGPLQHLVPQAEHKTDYEVRLLPGGALSLSWAGQHRVFESRFSIPGGDWADLNRVRAVGWRDMSRGPSAGERRGPASFAAQAGDLHLDRSYIAYDECILVRDRLTNTSSTSDLPVMLAHGTVPGPYTDLWLSGRRLPRNAGASGVPSNPSLVVLREGTGFAMVARDDVFRLHHRASCDGERAELSDSALVIRPGVTYQHEWLIFPLAGADYWQFVNAARRHFDTNFTIEGSFCFYGKDAAPWRIQQDVAFAGARYLSLSPQSYYKGMFPHGPFMQTLDQSKVIAMHRAIEAVSPQTQRLQYFNCFNRSRAKQDEDPDAWAASQA